MVYKGFKRDGQAWLDQTVEDWKRKSFWKMVIKQCSLRNDMKFIPPFLPWKMEMGSPKAAFLYNRVIFHFHDYGRKGKLAGCLEHVVGSSL